MHLRPLLLASALTLIAAACSPSAPEGKPAAAPASLLPSQAEMDKIKADPVPAARAASVLEFWLHYKLMQATGMEQALGGEAQAIATLKTYGMAVERDALHMRTQVPRMIPAAFDGNGLDAGMMGAGYGLLGGAITSSMLSGGLSNEQVAEAAQHGPIKFDDKDGSAQIDIAQDGMDTTLDMPVDENGVRGRVKTHIHIDACPDAEGKLTVTIETESSMSAGGKSGAVTLRYRQERWLDDDAHLLPISDGDKPNASEFFQIDMKGSGANGELSYYQDSGFTPDGKPAGGSQHYSGYSIFRPEESVHTEKMVQGSENLMRAFAQMMLDGSLGSKLSGGGAPWETGRCVDLKLRSSPEKRKGAKPDTHYTIFAEPRAKKDGMPAGGTVKATLNGAHSLSPQDKVKADAQFDYQNPTEKDQSASIDFVARSKRGVGKATLDFDTKKSGYRIVATGDGACAEPITVCDITRPFTNTICGGAVTWTHTPTSDKGGDFTFRYAQGKGSADAKGTYTLNGPEEKMTAIYQMGKICGHAAGMTACAPPRTFGAMTWTQIDDCSE